MKYTLKFNVMRSLKFFETYVHNYSEGENIFTHLCHN